MPVRRLAVIAVLVLAAAGAYRSFANSETGTGTLTLPQPAPNVGQNAPQFSARSADGEAFDLSDEGVYVLTFWSNLNVDSVDAQPGFERLAREYEDDGVSFAAVYVNSDPEPADVPYAKIRATGSLTSDYNVKRVPRLFLIEDGMIERAYDGYNQGIEEDLEEGLTEVLEDNRQASAEPPKPKE